MARTGALTSATLTRSMVEEVGGRGRAIGDGRARPRPTRGGQQPGQRIAAVTRPTACAVRTGVMESAHQGLLRRGAAWGSCAMPAICRRGPFPACVCLRLLVIRAPVGVTAELIAAPARPRQVTLRPAFLRLLTSGGTGGCRLVGDALAPTRRAYGGWRPPVVDSAHAVGMCAGSPDSSHLVGIPSPNRSGRMRQRRRHGSGGRRRGRRILAP